MLIYDLSFELSILFSLTILFLHLHNQKLLMSSLIILFSLNLNSISFDLILNFSFVSLILNLQLFPILFFIATYSVLSVFLILILTFSISFNSINLSLNIYFSLYILISSWLNILNLILRSDSICVNYLAGLIKFIIIFFVLTISFSIIYFFILIIFLYLNSILIFLLLDLKLLIFFVSTSQSFLFLHCGILNRTIEFGYFILVYIFSTWLMILNSGGLISIVGFILKLILILFWFGIPICCQSLFKIFIGILVLVNFNSLTIFSFSILYFSSLLILFLVLLEFQQQFQFNN